MQTISRQSNNVLRTVISILLAFVLMVGQMPALAYADTTNEQAVTQQEDTAATSSSETDSSDNSSPDDTGDSSAGATEESESTSTSDDSSEQTSTESKGSSVNNTNALNSEENLTVLENTLSKSDDVSEKTDSSEKTYSYQWEGADSLTHSEFGMIEITSNSDTLPKPENAKIVATLKDTAPILDALSKQFEGTPGFVKLYDFSLINNENGQEVELPSDVKIKISYISMETYGVVPAAYSLNNGSLYKNEATQLDSYTIPGYMFGISFNVSTLSDVAFVDISNLTEKVEEPTTSHYSKTFNTVGTLFTITISGESSDASFLAAFENAQLNATVMTPDKYSEDEEYKAIGELLSKEYEGNLNYYYSTFSLTSDGQPLTLPDDANVQISYDRAGFPPYQIFEGNPLYFNVINGQLSQLTVESTADVVPGMMWRDNLAATNQLGGFIALDGNGLTEKEESQALKPGTYVVDANLYVPGDQAPIGTNAYMTTSDFPPITPDQQNGELVVGDDGTITVTVYPVQEIFTLQHIEDGDNVHVQAIERGGYSENYGSHEDRITKIVATLDDYSGIYKFSNCVQYPTILQQDKNWDVYLEVDFSSAIEGGYDPGDEDEYTKVFTDDSTGISATVSTTEKDLGEKLDSLLFQAKSVTSGDDYESAKTSLSSQYVTEPPFSLYELSLTDELGTAVELNGNTSVMVAIPSDNIDSQYIDIWKISSEQADSMQAIKQDGKLLVQDNSLGNYAVVDASSTNKYITGTFEDDATGISGKLSVTDESLSAASITNPTFTTYTFGKSSTTDGAAYTMSMIYDISSVSVTYKQEIEELAHKYINSGMSSDEAYKLAEEEVKARYHIPPDFWFHPNEALLELSIPVEHESDQVLLVRDDGTNRYAESVAYEVVNNIAVVDLLSSQPRDYGKTLLKHMHNAQVNGIDSATKDAPVAYLLVISEDKRIAGAPSVVADWLDSGALIYSGELQEGVTLGNNSRIESGANEARDAGTYSVTVVPENGYTWIDGTTEPIVLQWSIEKALLKTELQNRYIAYNAVPDYELQVSGFVNGESADDIEGFVLPAIIESSKPQLVEPGKTYSLKIDYSKAQAGNNYRFSETPGTLLSVGMHPSSEPVVNSNLVYTGLEQTGVTEFSNLYNANSSVSTKSAVNAGTYSVTYYLSSSNTAWSDGSRGSKTLTWSIAPAELTATYAGEEIAQGTEPNLAVEVSGFVNGETAETAAGFEPPQRFFARRGNDRHSSGWAKL